MSIVDTCLLSDEPWRSPSSKQSPRSHNPAAASPRQLAGLSSSSRLSLSSSGELRAQQQQQSQQQQLTVAISNSGELAEQKQAQSDGAARAASPTLQGLTQTGSAAASKPVRKVLFQLHWELTTILLVSSSAKRQRSRIASIKRC